MNVVRTRAELYSQLGSLRNAGRSLGLVPTMGALHAGHVSLVDASAAACNATVVTIFVNPTQFAPHEDFAKYPRTLERDLELLAGHGCSLVFAPQPSEIYRPGHATYVEMGGPALPLEGKIRPGHFRGVATVVLKLFELVRPDVAFFGQKDYQQCLVIRRLAADFDLPIDVRVCPIVREPDGLAMSSRNAYLSADERRRALVLSRSLQKAAKLANQGERRAAEILSSMREVFATEPEVAVEYIVLADPDSLAEVEQLTGPTVALVAARVGSTRLIDNEILLASTRA